MCATMLREIGKRETEVAELLQRAAVGGYPRDANDSMWRTYSSGNAQTLRMALSCQVTLAPLDATQTT